MREHEVDMNRDYECTVEEKRTEYHLLTGQNMRQPLRGSWVVKWPRAEHLLDGAANLKSYIYIWSVSWVIVRQINTNERYINIIDGENTDFLNVIKSIHAHREMSTLEVEKIQIGRLTYIYAHT
jgi:hypothetical protein